MSLSGLASFLPLLAHGIGERSDLPLPLWLFAYGAGGVVVVSFAALGLLWPRSRLEQEIEGRPLPGWAQAAAPILAVAARMVSLAFFLVVLAAALFGDNVPGDNLAPTAVYVVFWVGVQIASALVGDVWRVLSPFDTLALLGARARRLVRPAAGQGRGRPEPGWGHWPATVGLFAFVWLELAYVDPASPRALGVAMAVYTALMLAGAARWGRGWLRRGEAFAAWFGLLSHMAVVHVDDRKRLRARPPLAGLVGIRILPGTVALVLVALGSTSFDGFSRTQIWGDVIGARVEWELVPFSTLGLLWMIAVVAVLYAGAMQIAGRMTGSEPRELTVAFVHSLVPIALAYAVAHYFSLLVFQGQATVPLLSDPFGQGWDVFGTADWRINYTAVSTNTIAWVQSGAIVAGHVAGVLVAHDRAVARFSGTRATRSQYPLLAAMVIFTVGGLALLLGA